jgi:hypothetical protein
MQHYYYHKRGQAGFIYHYESIILIIIISSFFSVALCPDFKLSCITFNIFCAGFTVFEILAGPEVTFLCVLNTHPK